jgi:putative heme iron utilization protein
MSAGSEARRYLRHHVHGVLSTISKKLGGYPFGSVVTCVPDHATRPVLFISRLAEHTKNIDADPRVSLLVRDDASDAQAAARLTLTGNAVPVSGDVAALQSRFLAYVPAAAQLVALGDFSFYRIEPVTVRYIGGFGAIHWISAREYAPPANSIHENEADIVAHMNAEHTAALRDYCRHFKSRQPAAVALIAVDCDGFDVRADDELLRFDFDAPVVDATTARAAFKELAAQARS